jgi:hypothetical protein
VHYFQLYLFAMPKAKAIKDGVSDTNKKSQTFRFSLATIRKLGIAASETGRSRTAYVEFALKNQFKKDGIT